MKGLDGICMKGKALVLINNLKIPKRELEPNVQNSYLRLKKIGSKRKSQKPSRKLLKTSLLRFTDCT